MFWEQFKGKKNTENILTQKASFLAPLIIDQAIKNSCSMSTEFNKDLDNNSEKIIFELLLFYLHLIDRITSQYLQINQRGFFIQTLILEIEKLFSKTYKNKEDVTNFCSVFEKSYNERQVEYGQYKMPTGKDGDIKDTLFWEFGKKIADITKSDTTLLVVIMYVQTITIDSVSSFKIPNLFNE